MGTKKKHITKQEAVLTWNNGKMKSWKYKYANAEDEESNDKKRSKRAEYRKKKSAQKTKVVKPRVKSKIEAGMKLKGKYTVKKLWGNYAEIRTENGSDLYDIHKSSKGEYVIIGKDKVYA